jgi:hypothetical protein
VKVEPGFLSSQNSHVVGFVNMVMNFHKRQCIPLRARELLKDFSTELAIKPFFGFYSYVVHLPNVNKHYANISSTI